MGGDLERSGGPEHERTNETLAEQLKLERERLAFTLRVAGIVAWQWDPVVGTLTHSTDPSLFLRLDPDEPIRSAADFFDRIHPDDRARFEAAVRETLLHGGDYEEEFRVLRGDGSTLWCVDKGRRVEDEPGKPHLAGIFVDITERKQREEEVRRLNTELARRAHELQTVLDVLPVGVFIAEDASCTSVRANPAGAAILGIAPHANASKSAPEADRLPFRLMRDGRELAPDELPMQRSARTGETIRGEELQILRADDAALELTGDAMPLFDEHQRIRGCVGAFIDVTEHKRLDAARAEEARRKDEFLATLAHELRNPLAPIRMAVELVRRRGPITPRQEPALGIITRQVEQLTRLVDDLLDVSRITRGKVELRKEWVDLRSVVARALEGVQPALEVSNHRPQLELPTQPLHVHGDPTRLSQALGNLLHNATKHTPPGGHIALSMKQQGTEVAITVRDEGAGIPPEVMPRIFELFTQADTSLERSHGGLGLGLTIAKQIVELHGGSIDATSEGVGRGSEFTIRLPYEAPRAEPVRPRASRAAVGAAVERRVLVVDDNHDAADSLAAVLEFEGHEVRTAYGAREALRASRSFRPEVVFLDIGMPEMNGLDVARRLRQQDESRHAHLIAMTGWGQEADRRRAKAAGFDDHLVKPVTPEAVAEVLARGGGSAS
jgi:signal transduction histidine kinase/ActR/RegA family two-component response regulator